MPSKSAKQANFMHIAAKSPEFAEKAGIPQSVAKEYNAEDERKKRMERLADMRSRKGGKR